MEQDRYRQLFFGQADAKQASRFPQSSAADGARSTTGAAAGGGGGRGTSTAPLPGAPSDAVRAADPGDGTAANAEELATAAGQTAASGAGTDVRTPGSLVDSLPPDPRLLLRDRLQSGGVTGGIDLAAAVAASVAPGQRSELEKLFAEIHFDGVAQTNGNIAALQAKVREAQLEANRKSEKDALGRATVLMGAYLDGQTYSEGGRPSAVQQRMDAAGSTAIGAEMADMELEMRLIHRRLRSGNPDARKRAVKEIQQLEAGAKLRLETAAAKSQRLILKELTQEAATLHAQVSRLELQSRIMRGEHTGRPTEEFLEEQNKEAGKAARLVFAQALGIKQE